MRPPVISPEVAALFREAPSARHAAVLFRGKIYVASPRHWDALLLALDGMTDMQKQRVSQRIADGKETMLFGHALGDGSGWEWNEVFQKARMGMYGLT